MDTYIYYQELLGQETAGLTSGRAQGQKMDLANLVLNSYFTACVIRVKLLKLIYKIILNLKVLKELTITLRAHHLKNTQHVQSPSSLRSTMSIQQAVVISCEMMNYQTHLKVKIKIGNIQYY